MNDSRYESPPPRRTSYLSRGRSRWGPKIDPSYNAALSAIPKVIPQGLSLEQLEALLVRVRIEEITKQINMGDVGLDLVDERDRSPSPEPIYDKEGKRLNTREQRAKDKLNKERTELVELALAMDPTFKPPPDYSAATSKKTRKILIPQDKYPEYNFIGLIIGPRGNTQKRLEKDTGCKIAIRGKGSVKEGKMNKNNNSEDEPLHVLISADSVANLDKGTKAISELLVPKDEMHNEHKKAQLRELAIINGTLRDNFWNLRTERSFEPANVKCAICGEFSHPTVDCPLKNKTNAIMPGDTQTMDAEYEQFLKDIGEDVGNAPPKPSQPPPPSQPAQAPAPWASLSSGAPQQHHAPSFQQPTAGQVPPVPWSAQPIPQGMPPQQMPGYPYPYQQPFSYPTYPYPQQPFYGQQPPPPPPQNQ